MTKITAASTEAAVFIYSTYCNLFVNIHSCHIGFTITLCHTQEFPSVFFVKTSVVGDQIDRRNTFRTQIFYCHVQQISCYALTAEILLRKNSTNIGCQIFSVVKIIFNNAQSANNLFAVQAQIPSVFCFFMEICLHTFQVCLFRHTPFVMEPCSCNISFFRCFS